MNRHFLPGRAGMAWAALLLFPVLAQAQSPYEGIYFGTYQGPLDDGAIALIVNDRGEGTLAAYDSVDDLGYIEQSIRVQSDGSFRLLTLRGVQINGQVTDSGISGRYYAAGNEGSFTGWRATDEGPMQDAAGYYSGPASITGSGPDTNLVINSRLTAIIAADGSAFFLLDHTFPWSGVDWTGDIDLDLDLNLDLSFGHDPGLGFDSTFPFGSGFGAPLHGGSGLDLPFPFGYGFDSPTPFAAPFDAPFPFGAGINTSFHIGAGFGFDSVFRMGPRNCGPFQFGRGLGWPFNLGLDYSIQVSILGLIDLDLNFSLPTCQSFAPWNHFEAPIADSGGFVQIAPDGYIQGSLPDGLALEGYLDVMARSAEGILSQQPDATTWSGHWEIERRDASGGLLAAKRFNRLPDINRDGHADILWRHAVTGKNAVWLMDGGEILAELPLEIELNQPWDLLWSLAAVTELNGDQQPDHVWRHAVSGRIFVRPSGDETPVHFALDPAWQVVASADFDADARSEILVRNDDSGENAVIVDLAGQAFLAPFPAHEDQSWSPAAVADFDGDTSPDVLWINRHTPGLLIWLMNGQTLTRELHFTPEQPDAYELAGVGDFDGDGSMDILWRDIATGISIVTLRPGEDDSEDISLGMNMAREWQMAAVGDLNGDGTDDLVWRHGLTGENTAWLVVDTRAVETAPLMPVPDPNWKIRP